MTFLNLGCAAAVIAGLATSSPVLAGFDESAGEAGKLINRPAAQSNLMIGVVAPEHGDPPLGPIVHLARADWTTGCDCGGPDCLCVRL